VKIKLGSILDLAALLLMLSMTISLYSLFARQTEQQYLDLNFDIAYLKK
jgi:hypothetical protein